MSKIEIITIGKNPRKRKAKKIVRVTKRRKIIRLKKNPPTRKRHETVIVGFQNVNGRRMYYTGRGFSKHRNDAKTFAGDGAKAEARRILTMLPTAIYGIKVENA